MPSLLFVLALQAVPDDGLPLFARGPANLLLDGAWLTPRARAEALGDSLMVLSLTEPGERRIDLARDADGIFAPLAARIWSFTLDEELLRLLWKHARALAEVDPPQLARFFENATKRGYAPRWDADDAGRSRWGWRDRLERLRPR